MVALRRAGILRSCDFQHIDADPLWDPKIRTPIESTMDSKSSGLVDKYLAEEDRLAATAVDDDVSVHIRKLVGFLTDHYQLQVRCTLHGTTRNLDEKRKILPLGGQFLTVLFGCFISEV